MSLFTKEEKEVGEGKDGGRTKAQPGMLSGSIKDEEMVSIYSGADAAQVLRAAPTPSRRVCSTIPAGLFYLTSKQLS